MSKASGHCDPKFSAISDIFSSAIESKFETGAAVAIEYKGEMVVDMYGGHKDAQRTKSWDKDTMVNVFSVTKGVTATCVARLIDQGKLDVNKKVTDYWPEYGCNGKEDTKVSDFLCHRSNNFGFQDGMPNGSWQDWDLFTKILEQQQPFKEPGSSQGYHALTMGWLVGEIIKRVDGRDTGTYFQEEIADPLNIDFKIGLQEDDFARCADMLMLDTSDGKSPLEMIKYVPNIFLSKPLRNMKEAIKGGDFKIAFQSRDDDDNNYVNEADWRKAQIPSANGHGTARGLAKLYGILSTGCEREGYRIMKSETLDYATKVFSAGPDSVLFGTNITFGLGYELGKEMTLIGNLSPRFQNSMFGHAGVGGAVAFGDASKEIGFAFICNEMHPYKSLYKSANDLTKALYDYLG